MFVPDKPFQLSLMSASKAGAYLSVWHRDTDISMHKGTHFFQQKSTKMPQFSS